MNNKTLIAITLFGLGLVAGYFGYAGLDSNTDTTEEVAMDTNNEQPSNNVVNTLTIQRTGSAATEVVIDQPNENESVSSPINITGQAPGYWFFEATAPVDVVNWDGLIIGEGFIQADGDWMTTNLVNFTGTVSYTFDPNSPSDQGWLILRRHNASGLPENDAAVEIPITLN